MNYAMSQEPTGLSRWTSRLSIFAAVLVVAAFLLHRLFAMPTPVALNMVALAYAGALAALVLAVLAAAGIWRTGAGGTARVVVGLVVSLGMFAGLAALFVLAREHPPLNDITTDTKAPPRFEALAKERGAGTNPAAYPGESFATIQTRAFPDLKPLEIGRPADETFELVTEAIKRLRMTIVASEPPGEGASVTGRIEAVDRTLITGFYDDIAIRVTGDGERARVDIRSASRYGVYDFGHNAERVRTIMREIAGRLEATIPAARGERPEAGKKTDKTSAKPAREDDPKPERRRKRRDRAQQDAPREPKQKTRQQD